jgi:hypothetical protein
MRTRNLTVVCVALLIAGIFFWPTIYRYEKTSSTLIRINRLTGYTAYFAGNRWIGEQEPIASPTPKEVLPLSLGYLRQVTGTASLTRHQTLNLQMFSGDLYNGSDWTVSRVVFLVKAKRKDGSTLWERKLEHEFSDIDAIALKPGKTSMFAIRTTVDTGLHSHEWSILEASGIPPSGYKPDPNPFFESFRGMPTPTVQ